MYELTPKTKPTEKKKRQLILVRADMQGFSCNFPNCHSQKSGTKGNNSHQFFGVTPPPPQTAIVSSPAVHLFHFSGRHPRLGLLCCTGFQCFLLFRCSERGTVCSTLSTCVLLVLFFTCCLSKLTTACSSFSYSSFLFSFFPIIYATLLPKSTAPPPGLHHPTLCIVQNQNHV